MPSIDVPSMLTLAASISILLSGAGKAQQGQAWTTVVGANEGWSARVASQYAIELRRFDSLGVVVAKSEITRMQLQDGTAILHLGMHKSGLTGLLSDRRTVFHWDGHDASQPSVTETVLAITNEENREYSTVALIPNRDSYGLLMLPRLLPTPGTPEQRKPILLKLPTENLEVDSMVLGRRVILVPTSRGQTMLFRTALSPVLERATVLALDGASQFLAVGQFLESENGLALKITLRPFALSPAASWERTVPIPSRTLTDAERTALLSSALAQAPPHLKEDTVFVRAINEIVPKPGRLSSYSSLFTASATVAAVLKGPGISKSDLVLILRRDGHCTMSLDENVRVIGVTNIGLWISDPADGGDRFRVWRLCDV